MNIFLLKIIGIVNAKERSSEINDQSQNNFSDLMTKVGMKKGFNENFRAGIF